MRTVVALWCLAALGAWTVAAYILVQDTANPSPAAFVLVLAGVAAAAVATDLVRQDRR